MIDTTTKTTTADSGSGTRVPGAALHRIRRLATRRPAQTGALALTQFALGAAAGRPEDPDYYRSLRQAPFAPPSWAFGPAWAIAKTGSSYALLRTAAHTSGGRRRRLLALFGADAAVFVTFSYVYFRRRSPVLAAVWTGADAAVTVALTRELAGEDITAAAALAPQLAWLTLATPVALWQAATNPDPLLGTPALVD
ncbi:MAG TPA: TspO/MBR family protein [Candidatus Nanopelagicales bacterium]|nr:TspO/MBR family protein [Candidatus Nanopelagicales bacterium]